MEGSKARAWDLLARRVMAALIQTASLRAQSETENATLIAVTGYGQEQDRKNALAAGFAHHLVKPVDTGKLLAILSACGSRHDTRQS